jgi:hypothetical protein
MAMHDNIQESASSTENPLLATRPVATSAGNHLRRARLRRRIVDEGAVAFITFWVYSTSTRLPIHQTERRFR